MKGSSKDVGREGETSSGKQRRRVDDTRRRIGDLARKGVHTKDQTNEGAVYCRTSQMGTLGSG